MGHDVYPDALIRGVLAGVKSVALVGASANQARPSFAVLRYLIQHGYTVFAVNPGLAGQTILAAPVFARLADIPAPIDMVDIFRNSEAAGPIVDEALALEPRVKVIWMQLTVRNDAAAARAEARGVAVIMNRCPKIEFGRLSGEIGWSGINSRVISSKVPRLAGNGVQRRQLNRP
jgi:predicted CoA-binding protein